MGVSTSSLGFAGALIFDSACMSARRCTSPLLPTLVPGPTSPFHVNEPASLMTGKRRKVRKCPPIDLQVVVALPICFCPCSSLLRQPVPFGMHVVFVRIQKPVSSFCCVDHMVCVL